MSVFRTQPKLTLALVISWLLTAGHVRAESELRRIEVPIYHPAREVILDIGDMIAKGMVEPRAAVGIDVEKAKCWVLRTPKGGKGFRWHRNLLNAWDKNLPKLTIDPKLSGVYDVYAQVRAVHDAGGASGIKRKYEGLSAMAFALELDDGSQREVVVAKGFPEHHFDTEVLAGHRWNLDSRKIILRSIGKPVYLYGLRFSPTRMAHERGAGETVRRWLATDHVIIAKDDKKHLAFPGAARLKNGDIAVVYREATSHGTEATGKISLSRSKDGGR